MILSIVSNVNYFRVDTLAFVGLMSAEARLLEHRLQLLKELLTLEGAHVDLPDFTSPT